MKKAASKTPAANLGAKRQCPKCATKFYDFGKEEILCPKCNTEIDPEATSQPPRTQPEPKRPPKVASTDHDEETPLPEGDAAAGTDDFESVEDLADDEDDLADEVAVDEEEDESF